MTDNSIPHPYEAAADLLLERTILVTGAGDGIGRAAARAFAAHGATVILLGRTVSKLEAVYDEIESAGGPQPAIYPMDLSGISEQTTADLRRVIETEFGALDGLLHNASLLGERRPIASASWEAWQNVMQVNVNAQFLLSRDLLPLLQASPAASVIFTSSGVGRQGRAYWGAYAVSKFATEGLMQVLADELENTSSVRVNSLNPGATNTRMRNAAYPAERPDSNPSPDEIMGAYLYLMGPDSRHLHGRALDAR